MINFDQPSVALRAASAWGEPKSSLQYLVRDDLSRPDSMVYAAERTAAACVISPTSRLRHAPSRYALYQTQQGCVVVRFLDLRCNQCADSDHQPSSPRGGRRHRIVRGTPAPFRGSQSIAIISVR